VLRVDAKVSVVTGDVETSAPELQRVVTGDVDGPLSEPHGRILSDEFGADAVDVEDGREWVGHSTPRRTYMADIGGRGGR
jgi:hypothetical protein